MMYLKAPGGYSDIGVPGGGSSGVFLAGGGGGGGGVGGVGGRVAPTGDVCPNLVYPLGSANFHRTLKS